MIYHQPAQLIGDLAQNAGNFATQQALGAENYPYAALGQQAQLAQAHDRQQRDLQQRQFDQQQWVEGQRAQQQSALDEQRAAERADYLAQQGQQQGNLQTARLDQQGNNALDLAGVNNSSREGIATGNRTSREGIAGDQLDYRRGHDQQTDQEFYDKLDAQKAHWAATEKGQAAAAQEKMLRDQAIANSPYLRSQEQALRMELRADYGRVKEIDRTLSGNSSILLDDNQKALLQTEKAQRNNSISQKLNVYRNLWHGAGQQQQQAAPLSPGAPPPVMQGDQGDYYAPQSSAAPAMGGGVEDAMAQDVRALHSMGVHPDVIKAHLLRKYPDEWGVEGDGQQDQFAGAGVA